MYLVRCASNEAHVRHATKLVLIVALKVTEKNICCLMHSFNCVTQ